MIPHRELKDTVTWECPNGHWSRVEYLLADGIEHPAICPVCQETMKLGTRKLEAMRNAVYNDYSMSYGNASKKKGGGKRAKNKQSGRKNASSPCDTSVE